MCKMVCNSCVFFFFSISPYQICCILVLYISEHQYLWLYLINKYELERSLLSQADGNKLFESAINPLCQNAP